MTTTEKARLSKLAMSLMAAVLSLLIGAVGADAATITFGSPLATSATLNTAANLGYPDNRILIPGTEEFLDVYHDGADTLLWNPLQSSGSPTAPAGGQILSITLKGCAVQPAGAPEPLTDIHFQDLSPQPDGGVKINLTTQTFTIPVCSRGGPDGDTLSTYQPVNLCVSAGDFVGFNDEGGFVPNSNGPPSYASGVPYMVIGAVSGSTLDSFIRNGGTNNGTVVSSSDSTGHDGFREEHNEELLLQSTLATGPDATPVCPGGSKGVAPPPPSPPRVGSVPHEPLVTATLPVQNDGMNKHGVVEVAVFCHSANACVGKLTLLGPRARRSRTAPTLGHASFSVAAHHTGKVKLKLSAVGQSLVRAAHRSLSVKATLSITPQSAPIDGAVTRLITLRGAQPRR